MKLKISTLYFIWCYTEIRLITAHCLHSPKLNTQGIYSIHPKCGHLLFKSPFLTRPLDFPSANDYVWFIFVSWAFGPMPCLVNRVTHSISLQNCPSEPPPASWRSRPAWDRDFMHWPHFSCPENERLQEMVSSSLETLRFWLDRRLGCSGQRRCRWREFCPLSSCFIFCAAKADTWMSMTCVFWPWNKLSLSLST